MSDAVPAIPELVAKQEEAKVPPAQTTEAKPAEPEPAKLVVEAPVTTESNKKPSDGKKRKKLSDNAKPRKSGMKQEATPPEKSPEETPV